MTPDPRELLKGAGLRLTAPRVAVLEWLASHPHSTAELVAEGVRARLGTVSTQAVYDVLNTCSRANLVRRIEPAGQPARYETRTGTTTTTWFVVVAVVLWTWIAFTGRRPVLSLPTRRGSPSSRPR